ncbi:MAG: carboxypeptidase regulatory-like domain-containing protein, partial [Bryobacteraceae bacterium]
MQTARRMQAVVSLLVFSLISVLAGTPASAQQSSPSQRTGNTAGKTTPSIAQQLPLRRVVLYKSGVGYFEHAGKVNGNETVEITLTSGQLNDVLKSLTALDLSGGRITGASYNSQEPAQHQLMSLPVPVAGAATLRDLLTGLRGARLEVRQGGIAYTGRLLSVEQKTSATGSVQAEHDQISLLGDAGEVRSFVLDAGTKLRFADRELEQELARALGLMDASHAEDERRLVLSTTGVGERDLRVSYISEVPVWKTTYRVVLPASAERKPLLQGWAIVDNTVGEDWVGVELSLAAGAPQSFIQQLSQPYYTRRPEVELPTGLQLTPQTHGGMLTGGSGTLTGTVNDPDDESVEGASVRVLDMNNGLVAQTSTDEDGEYSFEGLPPGNFKIEISKDGFQTLELSSVNLLSGRENHYDNKLRVGAVSETVDIKAGVYAKSQSAN